MKKILIIFLSTVLLASCEDMLDTKPEINVNINNFWKDEHEVEAFANSMHIAFRNAFSNIPWIFGEARAQSTDGMTNWLWTHIYDNDLAYEHLVINWSSYYKVIASANTILDNYHRANMSAEKNDYYVGMAKFFRAYTYFFIVRVWGEAPLLKTSTDVKARSKASIELLKQFIIKDAEEAQALLPEFSKLVWTNGAKVNTKQLPGKGAADALLAHVFAWFGSLDKDDIMLRKSIEASTRVINNSEYSLAPSINSLCENVLLGNSTEGIFEIEARANDEDQLGNAAFLATLCTGYPIIPKKLPGDITGWDMYCIINAESVMILFNDLDDERRSEYFYKLDEMALLPESAGRAYLQKWRHVVLTNDGSDEFKTFEDNIILYRLADIILLRAEIHNRLGQTGDAIADLNTIRSRAKAKLYAEIEGDLKQAILNERYKELYLENHRFFDLVRNDELRNFVEPFKDITDQEVKDGAFYWPVAKSNFKKNPEMRQNIYWKQQGL